MGFYCIGGDRLVHVGQREKRLCNKNFFLVFLSLKKKLAVSSLKNATFFSFCSFPSILCNKAVRVQGWPGFSGPA